jgi:SAM-dependent methyltransferase
MTAHDVRPSIADAFDRSHGGRMQSAIVEQIYRSAFGDDYPETAQPNAFYSRTTLHRLATALHVGTGQTIVDLGCGHGGPGLWVAQLTGANLIGIDLSPTGIEVARRRAAETGLAERAQFRVGDITATGSPDSSCDGAMSLDVLPFVPDQAAAVREVTRMLRPGGRFAFTTWEELGDSPLEPHALAPDSETIDYRNLVEEAGLQVEICEEPPNWRNQQQRLAEGVIAAEAEVSKEMGAHYPAMARTFLQNLSKVRYLFVVARRPAETSK